MRGELLADGVTVLRFLMKIVNQKENRREVVAYVVKNKVAALELLGMIVDSPGRIFRECVEI